MPRVVLPITSRGLVLTDRLCWGILAVAMAIAAGLILYLNQGTTFSLDELTWLYSTPDLGLGGVLEPHNGNLIATSRLVYKAILETAGSGYLPFRILGIGAVLLSAGLFYALARRRIGALPALAPSFVLLLFGSASEYLVAPIGFTALLSIAAGLGALLCLERGDPRGDVAACALLVLSIATFTTGLAFLVGVAVSVLLRSDRTRRAWVFLVPLVLYAAWWVWSLSEPASAEGETKLSNALLIPSYIADSLAAALAALTGLDFDFDESSARAVALEWGRVLAVPALVLLVLRLRRGNLPRSLWASLAIVLTFWTLGALAFNFLRVPGAPRYTYMAAVGVLLVATDAARSVRFTGLGLAALFGACAISLATNVALLRDAAASYRNGYAIPARAQFAMLDLARDRVSPGFRPGPSVPGAGPFPLLSAGAGAYLAVADRYGPLGLPLSELGGEDEDVRERADRMLIGALGLRLERAPVGGSEGKCERVRSDAPGGGIMLELPPGGATLRAQGAAPAKLTVGRFATSPSVKFGTLDRGKRETLRIPPDISPTRWKASVEGARAVEVCALG